MEMKIVTTQVTRPPGVMAEKKVYAQGIRPAHTPFFGNILTMAEQLLKIHELIPV